MLMPGIPLEWLAKWRIGTSRTLFRRYEPERFSGGVNLSAQERNREIDRKIYVDETKQQLWVSPRTLKHLEGLKVT